MLQNGSERMCAIPPLGRFVTHPPSPGGMGEGVAHLWLKNRTIFTKSKSKKTAKTRFPTFKRKTKTSCQKF